MATTYSGAQLRDIHKKCEEERDALQAQFDRLKQSVKVQSQENFDIRHRGRTLAEYLGFDDVTDALVAIASSEYKITYHECFERLHSAEAELNIEKKEVELMKIKTKQLEHDKRVLTLKLSDLEKQYDDLLAQKDRASTFYRSDYKKWRNFYKSTFSDDPEHRKYENQAGINEEERKRRRDVLHQKRTTLIGENLAACVVQWDESNLHRHYRKHEEILKDTNNDDKENETPGPPSKKRRIDNENPSKETTPSAKPSTPLQSIRNGLGKSVTNLHAPSSPTIFLDNDTTTHTPTSISFKPMPIPIHIKEEPPVTPVSVRQNDALNSSPLSRPHMPSSDTEDDSQAIFVPSTSKATGETVLFRVPAPPTAGPSNIVTPTPSTTTSRALQTTSEKEKRFNTLRSLFGDLEDEEEQFSIPVKMPPLFKPRLPTFSSTKGKEREAVADISTPTAVKTTTKRDKPDYSSFKGRGRYGKATEDPEHTSINALYVVNTNQNGGLDYQYDEVVRNREERQKLGATDCECCREYYEGIGPLPQRLQRPLWKSPPTTPVKPCPRHHLEEGKEKNEHYATSSRSVPRRSDIESHKKAISRHRQTWARAPTPPGYWDIGFPNTQEVGDINEKAREMHKKKQEFIEKEANMEGGRYRRK